MVFASNGTETGTKPAVANESAISTERPMDAFDLLVANAFATTPPTAKPNLHSATPPPIIRRQPYSRNQKETLTKVILTKNALTDPMTSADPRESLWLMIKADAGARSGGLDSDAIISSLDSSDFPFEDAKAILEAIQNNNDRSAHDGLKNLPLTLVALKKFNVERSKKIQLVTTIAKRANEISANSIFNAGDAYFNLAEAIDRLRGFEWSDEEIFELITTIAKNGSENIPQAYLNIPIALGHFSKKSWTEAQKKHLLLTAAKLSGKLATFVYSSSFKHFNTTTWSDQQKYDLYIFLIESLGSTVKLHDIALYLQALLDEESDFDRWTGIIRRLLHNTSDYNCARTFELLAKTVKNLKGRGYDSTSGAELAAEILGWWPRIGLNVAEGIFEAMEKGILPVDITPLKADIFRFVERTNGFIPAIYSEYVKKGESIFQVINEYRDRILADDLGYQDIIAAQKKHGEDFLLGVIQITSPTSGASFLKKNEQLGLLKRVLAQRDLRSHVPAVWKGHVERFEIEHGVWAPRDVETIDPQGHISALLQKFRSDDESRIKDDELVKAIKTYLDSNREDIDRNELRRVLYLYAGQDDVLKEKIDRIQRLDYGTLLLLEQLFSDKNALPQTLMSAIQKVPDAKFAGKGTYIMLGDNPARLVKQLKELWQKDIQPERKLSIFAKMLAPYSPYEVRLTILSRPDIPEEMKEAMELSLNNLPTLNRSGIINELLEEPSRAISREKAKFAFTTGGKLPLEIRAVKGITYGMHGLTSGVCIATDVELWKDPKFKLLPLIDKSTKEVVGYIHVFETVIKDRTYITLPGINPSAEFLGQVNAEELYDRIIEAVIPFTKKGKYAGIYIPTNKYIHSNRSDIQRAIASKRYPTKKIPKVKWTHQNRANFPFEDVYVVAKF